jgi:S1-C subfamily serine protease
MPALLGYSGGPAVDGEGRLVGVVTALTQPGAAPLLAALSGLDLDGLVRGSAGREVFLLSAEAVLREAARLAPAEAPPLRMR